MIAEKADTVVEIAELSRRFGRTVALDGVSLHVPRGVVFGLVGENGAGKTTLIEWTTVCRGSIEEIHGRVTGVGARIVEEHTPSLDEIFVARVGSQQPLGVEG